MTSRIMYVHQSGVKSEMDMHELLDNLSLATPRSGSLSTDRSSTSLDDLPDGLIAEILKRLPVKTLVQLTSVCKMWCSIIKSPNFICAHLSRSVSDPSNYYFLLIPRSDSPSFIVISDHNGLLRHPGLTLPFETQSKTVSFLGSSNGLVCLTDYDWHVYGRDIYLINPFIHKYKKLDAKSSSYSDLIDTVDRVVVVFHYSEAEHDYNVCRILHRYADNEPKPLTKVEIYSLNSGKWKGVDALLDQIPIDVCPTWVQGWLYWLTPDDSLLCFDLKTRVFGMIELPTAYFQICDRYRFIMLNRKGSVVLCTVDRACENPSLRVCLLLMRKDITGQVQWEELYYESSEFIPDYNMGFSGSGRLMFQEASLVDWGTSLKIVSVTLDNPCAREDLELESDKVFTGHADVLESLVLLSD